MLLFLLFFSLKNFILVSESPSFPKRCISTFMRRLCGILIYLLSMIAIQVDAFIALPGGYGTMEELLEITTWYVILAISKLLFVKDWTLLKQVLLGKIIFDFTYKYINLVNLVIWFLKAHLVRYNYIFIQNDIGFHCRNMIYWYRIVFRRNLYFQQLDWYPVREKLVNMLKRRVLMRYVLVNIRSINVFQGTVKASH